MKIAFAETGYICLSNAILLAQHNEAQEMESDPISCKEGIKLTYKTFIEKKI